MAHLKIGLRSVNRDTVYVGCLFLEYKLTGKADFQTICLAVELSKDFLVQGTKQIVIL